MHIENRRPIEKFVAKHASARTSFAEWLQKVEAAQWNNFIDVRATFNSADYVNGLVIFNIAGNNYRLVAEIVYKDHILRIAKVGTHADYNGWNL